MIIAVNAVAIVIGIYDINIKVLINMINHCHLQLCQHDQLIIHANIISSPQTPAKVNLSQTTVVHSISLKTITQVRA